MSAALAPAWGNAIGFDGASPLAALASMLPPLDPGTLSPAAQKLVAPTAPEKLQEVAAKGIAPGLRPGEVMAVLLLLRGSDRATVRDNAERTLGDVPEQLLSGALGTDLPPQVIDVLSVTYRDRIDVLEKLLAMPRIDAETVVDLAAHCSEQVSELIATNEQRLLAHPRIIEKLYMNRRTRMSTAGRLVELAARNKVELLGLPAWKEAVEAIKDELIVEPTAEPTPEDIAFKEALALAEQLEGVEEDTHDALDEGGEVLKERFKSLFQQVAEMKMSEKIRTAMLGTREQRMILVRDRNKIVATAVVRSPLMQESEAALIACNRNMSVEVLRIIASVPELVKSYVVKRALVENPKTPIMTAQRLVQHLRENDLKILAKSKNVTGPVKDAARRHLERRNS
ncbi:MAG: hypothetical protein WKG00_40480 [Polyangiaceae bacterium]